MHITDHAYERGRERMGLNKEAFARTAAKAFAKGITLEQTKGKVRRYILAEMEKKHTADNTRLYGEFVFIFCGVFLVTVTHLPKEYRNYKAYKHETNKTDRGRHRRGDHRLAA